MVLFWAVKPNQQMSTSNRQVPLEPTLNKFLPPWGTASSESGNTKIHEPDDKTINER